MSPSPSPAPTPTPTPPPPSHPTTDPRQSPPPPSHNSPPPPPQSTDSDDIIIDMEILEQILDLDDDDDSHEFSKSMTWDYFSQASKTFGEMDLAYAANNLSELSTLAHFLKGSSAALGVSRVQASCEQVQHYGDLRDEQADRDLSPSEALEKIRITLCRVKEEYAAAEKWLKDYFSNLPTVST